MTSADPAASVEPLQSQLARRPPNARLCELATLAQQSGRLTDAGSRIPLTSPATTARR